MSIYKDRFCSLDNLLDGFTYEDLITAVQSNEMEINKQSVKKVFNEILNSQLEDARAMLEKNMDNILSKF